MQTSRPTSSAPLTVTLIGAGNVASHLGRALCTAGVEIKGICARTPAHAQELAAATGCRFTTTDPAALPASDILIISVSDDAITAVCRTWAAGHAGDIDRTLVIHTAGSVALNALTAHVRRAAVVYPLQTFSKARQVRFDDVPLFVEGADSGCLGEALALAHCLSDYVTELSSEKRRHLHLAAVFASNFVNHLYALSYGLLRREGIAPEALLPLIRETATKVCDGMDPVAGQTGPAVRGDHKVLAAQEALLKGTGLEEVYRLLSESIERTARNAALR